MRLMAAAAASGLATVPSAYAQSASSPEPLADRFLQALKIGKVDNALKGAAGDSKLFASRIADDPTIRRSDDPTIRRSDDPTIRRSDDPTIATQIESAIKTYGPVLSWERVASRPLGTMVRRVRGPAADLVQRIRLNVARRGA